MKEILTYAQIAFAAVGGYIGWFLGGVDGFLYALIAFVVVDYILGVMCAIVERHLSSDIGAKGIFQKVVIFVLVGIANVIDSNVIGDGGAIRTAVIFFYLSNEGISITENATRLGLPVPEKLVEVLEQLKEGEDEDDVK
ncbi:phage holin family protein [Proteinivorax tanatarense]|uniref:Phage holin family protein n=1 Tax=Proteinivorax tanatarense TaxID=1260629 RepID=A0AAU7VK40_9FIRM